MKFLCDRCKTRYSIGDDRVRGKILKIRCKNCANVITVREGMTVDDDVGRGRPTTAAPINTAGPQVPAGGALASAFAQQLAKPPPALEEEWYVSIDGAQAGPFGLAAAQRWVAAKPFDAELHCWSEGFDDWLPVDKVSHFRGLRRKPVGAPPVAAPLAPPIPRPRVPEEEPKPLFAATMASLEKPSVAPPVAMALPSIKSPSAQVPSIPANGMTAKANGTGPAIVPRMPVAAKTNGQNALAAAFDMSNAPDAGTPADARAVQRSAATGRRAREAERARRSRRRQPRHRRGLARRQPRRPRAVVEPPESRCRTRNARRRRSAHRDDDRSTIPRTSGSTRRRRSRHCRRRHLAWPPPRSSRRRIAAG